MKVNQLAENLAVTPDTVRYYTRIGYLRPHKNISNGYKDYNQEDLQRLRFILNARQLGFSVQDLGLILQEAEKGNSPCPLVRELISKRLRETEKKFVETVALRKRMCAAERDWRDKPNKAPTGKMVCHLIENFMSEE